MSTLQVSLFGKFCALRDGQQLQGMDARKDRELFSYLLLFRHQPHPRERLASLFWADCSTAQSKKYLRQSLWHLQTALSAINDQTEHSLLRAEPDWIQLNGQTDIWLDVALFEQAAHLTQNISGRDLNSQEALTLQNAVSLYKDDLLSDWYYDWCVYERERLQRTYLSMLDKLISYCETCGDYDGGILYAEHILRCDRAHERTHRRLMRLLYLNGDRTAALRQYQRCEAALKEELNVAPTERTQSLCEQLRADYVNLPIYLSSPDSKGVVTPVRHLPILSSIIDHLKQLQAVLNGLQKQLQSDIETVEQSLQDEA